MLQMKQELLASFSSIYCCKNDLCLTFLDGEELLAELTGYTAEDVRTLFGNSLMQLIEEDKREYIQKAFAHQLEQKAEFELLIPIICKNGDRKWIVNRGRKIVDADGQESIVGLLVDITDMKVKYDEEKLATKILQDQAQQDSLTRVYNANTSRKKAEEYLAGKVSDKECALLIIDLDDFKQVNDQNGHMAGDEVLIQAAQTIKRLFRAQDIVGRIGGDEFFVLMKDISDKEIVKKRCVQLNDEIHDVYKEDLENGRISCSIGVALSPIHGETYIDLFHCADKALYQAKDLGKDCYVFYHLD